MFTVEHITYRHGDKQQFEHDFDSEADANSYARGCFNFGGRVWINNNEITGKDLYEANKIHG